jgi:hypothetical protein
LCPHAYFSLKTVAVFVVMVAADADRSCEEQQQMIDPVLCISTRTSSLLTPVLSPASFFCAVISVFHDCSLCNLLGAAIPHLAGRNYSRLGHPLTVSLGTHDGDNRIHTTGSEEDACNAPRCGQNAANCSNV